MDSGDLCEADIGDLREVDNNELAIARSQLPPNLSVIYRCAVDVSVTVTDVRLARVRPVL